MFYPVAVKHLPVLSFRSKELLQKYSGEKGRVRTQFYYTNNDKRSFNVLYDDKHLVNVVLPDAKPSFFRSEVIFYPKSEKISVCLIRTSLAPFISSIEVYNLDDGMYDGLGSDEGLILLNRVAFAASAFTSYPLPLDPYGRQWDPYNNPKFNKLTPKTLASSIDITDASNKPPETVMSQALSASDLKFNIGLSLTGRPVYLALYFSEPQSLNQNQRRSFNVSLDNKQINSVPIVPVFGEVIQVIEQNVVVTSKSQVTFQQTKDSNLPPLINAFELYSISDGETKVMPKPDRGEMPPLDRIIKPEDIENAKEALAERGKNNWKKIKLPVILGTSSGTGLVLASAFVFWKKSSKAKPDESNTLPTTSSGHGTVSGESPLIGQQLKSDAKHQV